MAVLSCPFVQSLPCASQMFETVVPEVVQTTGERWVEVPQMVVTKQAFIIVWSIFGDAHGNFQNILTITESVRLTNMK